MVGGGIGAAFRHGLFILVQNTSGSAFPFGTLSVNLLGSFLIGLLWCLLEGVHLSAEVRLFLFTGLLGGFTTFSAYTREIAQLIKVGEWKEAILYLSVSNIFGIAMVFLGFIAARQLLTLIRT